MALGGSAKAEPESAAPATNARQIADWQAMRFGMFIHWGPVSLKGTEIGWSRGDQVPVDEYDHLYTRFNPTNFNAEAWVKTAKAAGMKYIVFTTKHHDGFCMFDTKQTEYNIMNTPFHRDVVKELSEACRKYGMAFGTYHSTCDWHHPDFPRTSPGGSVRRETSNLDRYEAYLKAQVKELITGYGPLLLIWFDVPQEFDTQRGLRLEQWARSLQPGIIINDRTGAQGDYDTPEQRIGGYQDTRPWETCMTICNQWSWKPNDPMKSLEQCIHTLVLCAGGDGNLLFNVGPTPDGVIEQRQIDRLAEMGQWLEKNGESIRDTRGGPFKPGRDIASTRRGNTIYVHILKWSNDDVVVPGIGLKVVGAKVLGGGKATVKEESGELVINVPKDQRAQLDTIVQIDFDGSVMAIPAVKLPLLNGAVGSASNTYHQMQDYSPDAAFDNDPSTRWATDNGTRQAWIAVKYNQPRTIRKVRIAEAVPYDNRVQKFEFQYRQGGEWKTLFGGEKLGSSFQKTVEPVSAQEFRLNILDATEGPTISEIEIE